MNRVLHVLLFLFIIGTGAINAQSTRVTGLVTDATDGSPIPGASILVKGTTTGTITSFDGNYSLEVPADATTLIFSFIGMKSQEITFTGQSVINVVLQVESIGVEEVVVSAYGTKGKVGLKGAMSVVTAKDLEQVPVASFDQMLQGKTTGLQIASGSGQPGSSSTKVRIRGTGSIMGGNEPLYVVDGVPIEAGAFASLNANDFETVTVLKDASSTAIYGSRASNGVILITTKNGVEGKTTVNVRHQSGVSIKSSEKFEMMNTNEKLWFEEIAQKGPGWEFSQNNPMYSSLSTEAREAQDSELSRLRTINTNWEDIFFRMGQTHSTEANFSGGNKKTKFYASIQKFYQEGLSERSDLSRYAGRLNLEHNISDKFKIGIRSSLGNSNSNLIESEGGIALMNPFAAVYLANPWENPYLQDGSPNSGSYLYTNPELDETQNGLRYNSYRNTGANVLDQMQNSTYMVEETKFVGAFNFVWNINEYLSAKTQYGLDYRQTITEREVRPEALTSLESGDYDEPRQGSMSKSYGRRDETNFTNTLDYKRMLGEDHLVTVVVGTEYINRKISTFGFTGYGLDVKRPGSLAGITSGTDDNDFIPSVGGSETERALFSMFSLFNYTFKDKYTFSGSLRRDGSSAFGADHKYATLYSAGLTWDVTREDFIASKEWINNLKFRISYGLTGNQDGLDDFETLTTWQTYQYNNQDGYALLRSGDPTLKWEIAKKFNVGFDYNLFANRLNGSFDVYNDITDDLFIDQNFSSWAGIPGNSKKTNAGKVRNRGIELLINYDIVRRNSLKWSVGANFSYNDNEILDLGQVTDFEYGTSIVKEGLPLGSHYMVKWGGVNPANGNALYYTKDGDLTENYSSDDSVAKFGTSNAPFTGGFNTSVSYKGIELSAQFSFAQGFSRFNNQSYFMENPDFAQYNMSRDMLNVWQSPGDITEIQSVTSTRQFSSKDIEDASYLRFRNLTLAYNLPKAILNKVGVVNHFRLYAQAQNLFTWTKWTGFDPEDSNNIASFEYPTPRILSVGIDVSF